MRFWSAVAANALLQDSKHIEDEEDRQENVLILVCY